MKVIFLPEVQDYLFDVVRILHTHNYFGFHDSAVKYIDELILDIETNIHFKTHKKAPAYFTKYGNELWYASFRRNKNTTWYVFFTRFSEELYLIKYISNNHVIGQYFI